MTTRQQSYRRREAAIAIAKTAVTVASVAAALGGCALIGLTDSAPAAEQDTTATANTNAPQQISANVMVVGSPTPIPSVTSSAPTATSGQSGAATLVPTRTPRPTVTPAPTPTIIQPGQRQPGFGNNDFFVPRTRTSR